MMVKADASSKNEGWIIPNPHSIQGDQAVKSLGSSSEGLSRSEAAERLKKIGQNVLPRSKPPGLILTFLKQFLSPLIYILLIAAVVAIFLQEWKDSIFIFGVLILNAIIGTIQEYSAQRNAEALQNLVEIKAKVIRDGKTKEINAREIVPGDIVLLESGMKVPADTRLLSSQDLGVDESLLTGESEAVQKEAEGKSEKEAGLGDRLNMVFAGTSILRGRGKGVVCATGANTEIGHLAEALQREKDTGKPPLMIRMERFTYWIAVVILLAVAVIFVVELSRGSGWTEVFLLAVAIAVAAIPEGLPVALTVSLSNGMRRMAQRSVIVRKLVAVESLGSCTMIASDKTGTLTANQLTVEILELADGTRIHVTGEGLRPDGDFKKGEDKSLVQEERDNLERIGETVALCNEGSFEKEGGEWTHHGDSVDVAMLVLAQKMGLTRKKLLEKYPQKNQIPFESKRKFAASVHEKDGRNKVMVKGAVEKLMSMCSRGTESGGDQPLSAEKIKKKATSLAREGYRVVGVAAGEIQQNSREDIPEKDLKNLVFLGLVGMRDPLRSEAKEAVRECQKAGVEVSMITGDHPETALSIARELKFADSMEQVVTGKQLKEALGQGEKELDRLTKETRVFARVEPEQKVDIVKSCTRNGHFIAMTGDGANDAPALSAAHVGVAMGKRGTDVARESAELIITDDNFASIVAGIHEGRVAYANVRNVIFFLISTAAALIWTFTLALFANIPAPFIATQMLWLNLVTNGIQDVSLGFEPAEGNEMSFPPRSPKEPIFNRLMIQRILISAGFMGAVAFSVFWYFLTNGWDLASARNSTLLLMVFFGNIHVFNSRSEYRMLVTHNPLRNPVLLFGTLTAQLIHIGAMYTPGLKDVLEIHPISFAQWGTLLGFAFILVFIMEAEKLIRRFLKERKTA